MKWCAAFVALSVLVIQSDAGNKCHMKFQVQPGHSACLEPAKSYKGGGVISGSDKNTILDTHSRVRREVEPTANGMQRMVWDDELASVAHGWASQCTNGHDEPLARRIPGKYQSGQNIGQGYDNVEALLTAWEQQKSYFVFNGNGNDVTKVGHYTQMIWATTAKVGCAYAKCETTGTLYVCNYAPPGNQDNLGRPYTDGDQCAQCPQSGACSYGICECGGKVCENGGAIDLTRCACSCSHLNPYPTETCSLNCTAITSDIGTNCEQSDCSNSLAPATCPWHCKDCPYAGVDYNSAVSTHTLYTALLLPVTVFVMHWLQM